MTDTNNLALIGVEEVEWWPSIRATAEGAHSLTQAIVALAHHALEEERSGGSDIPSLMASQVDPETGEIKEVLSLSYEAVLRERALTYLQSLKLEADASILEILADIFERQLYMWHPDQWDSLGTFLLNMATGKSPSYQATIEGLVTVVLPYLHVENLVSVRELMELVTEGGLSNLYHLKSEMVQAVMDNSPDSLREMLDDARSLGRAEIWQKYKGDKLRVPPAKATLTHTNPGWQLVIQMTDSQKGVILNCLGRRITFGE